ncbi:MAG: sigma-70 family RNA polymerase sigma factor [Luteolibacter sp.]
MESFDPLADPSTSFVSLITRHQGDVWAFILTLMPGHADAKDVLQKTNVVLWQKRDDFTMGTNFKSWALTCARFTVMDHLKRMKSDKMRYFDDSLLETMADEASHRPGNADLRLEVLEGCLQKLRPQERELVEFRYSSEGGLDEFATKVGRSVSALSVSLHRLRTQLRKCILSQLEPECPTS